MSVVYVCNNPDHPVAKHSPEYSSNTQDGFCPDCPYGEGILLEREKSATAAPAGPVVNGAGLCVLVCDASGSMVSPAFADSTTRKIDMVVRSAANGIVDNYTVTEPHKAYIALVGFGGKAMLLKDRAGQPFIKPIAEIQKEYPTAKELGDFIREQLAPDNNDPLTSTIDRDYTDMTKALALAHGLYEGALCGDLSEFGFETRFTLMEHNPRRQRDNEQFNVPNVRVLMYSDGEHNPADGTPLANPFEVDLEAKKVSVLMTVFFGDGNALGATQMRSQSGICPMHEQKGYFLINSAERYQTLRKLFRMASGASGFCPVCLAEASREWNRQ